MRTIFLGLVGGLLVYEIAALHNDCPDDTISEIVWSATTRRPIVPFAAGVLCGHFFWQRDQARELARPVTVEPGARSTLHTAPRRSDGHQATA